MVTQMSFVSSLVGSDLHLSTLRFSACGILRSSVELSVLRSVSVGSRRSVLCTWGRNGGEFWVWEGKGRVFVWCGGDESEKSSLGESGSERRPAKMAYSGVQRIERAQEATKRRAMARGSRKLYSQSLLVSLQERIKQNHWVPALEVCFHHSLLPRVSKYISYLL